MKKPLPSPSNFELFKESDPKRDHEIGVGIGIGIGIGIFLSLFYLPLQTFHV